VAAPMARHATPNRGAGPAHWKCCSPARRSPAIWAERYGYVNRALPDAELDPFVDTMARRIGRIRQAGHRRH